MNLSGLKKFGLAIAKVAGFVLKDLDAPEVQTAEALVGMLAPKSQGVIQKFDSGARAYIGQIDTIIETVEAAGIGTDKFAKLTGEQKFAAGANLLSAVTGEAFSLVGHDITDQDLLDKAFKEASDATQLMLQARVDFRNATKPKN